MLYSSVPEVSVWPTRKMFLPLFWPMQVLLASSRSRSLCWMLESSNEKEWDKAIGAYQTLVEKYPDSDLADDGLYFAAQAAQQLKNCTEARTYLGLITTKYPRSNVIKQAKELDAQVKRDLKNKSKCTS